MLRSAYIWCCPSEERAGPENAFLHSREDITHTDIEFFFLVSVTYSFYTENLISFRFSFTHLSRTQYPHPVYFFCHQKIEKRTLGKREGARNARQIQVDASFNLEVASRISIRSRLINKVIRRMFSGRHPSHILLQSIPSTFLCYCCVHLQINAQSLHHHNSS